jgi:hypothetical protein
MSGECPHRRELLASIEDSGAYRALGAGRDLACVRAADRILFHHDKYIVLEQIFN